MARIMKGVAATLTYTARDENDVPKELGAAVTVAVTDASGTTVLASTTATSNTMGTYTVTLPAQSALGLLTATWTSSGISWTTEHEIVGRRYYTVADLQASHDELADGGDFDDAELLRKRDAIEVEIERVTGLSFCRRRARILVDGTGTMQLQLPVRYIRRIVSASIAASFGSTSLTALTAGQIAAIALDDWDPPHSCNGLITRTDSSWPSGRGRIILDVEYGFDAPPPDVLEAAMRLAYWRHHQRNTEVLDRAVSFGASGGSYQLAQPSQLSTGIPVVDAALSPYSRTQSPSGAPSVASGVLRLNTSRNSLFHR